MPDLAQPFGPLHEGYIVEFVPEVSYVRQGNKVHFFSGKQELTESIVQSGEQIVENFTDLELVEKTMGDKTVKTVKDGQWFVEGPYQRGGVKNANGRTYGNSIWERIFGDPNSRQQQAIKARGMLGHFEHPKDGRTDGSQGAILTVEVALKKVNEAGKDGVVCWGKSEVFDTPNGLILQEYIRKNVRWGISSRGNGSVDSTGVVNEKDYDLETFDAVMRPSTPGAYPKVTPGIPSTRESVDESAGGESVSAAVEPHRTSVHLVTHYAPVKEGAESDTVSQLDVNESVSQVNRGKIVKALRNKFPNIDHARAHRMVELRQGSYTNDKQHELTINSTNHERDAEDIAKELRDKQGLNVRTTHVPKDKFSKIVVPVKEDINESITDVDAQACVEAIESLLQEPVENLDESERDQLIGSLLKRFGQAAECSALGTLPKGKSKALRGSLAQKLNAVMAAVQANRDAQAVDEAIVQATSGKEPDKGTTVLVHAFQRRFAKVVKENNQLRAELEAEQARSQTAEESLTSERALRVAAIERATASGVKLGEVEDRLNVATDYIAAASAESETDPVQEAVDVAVRDNPALAKFHDWLVKADSAQEVVKMTRDLTEAVGATTTRANGAVALAERTTLPTRMVVESEQSVGTTPARGPVSPSVRLAGSILRNLKPASMVGASGH